jgi:hypothetical protein
VSLIKPPIAFLLNLPGCQGDGARSRRRIGQSTASAQASRRDTGARSGASLAAAPDGAASPGGFEPPLVQGQAYEALMSDLAAITLSDLPPGM